MKICFLAHNLKQDNGGGVLSYRLIEGLKPLGEDIVALTSEAGGMDYERVILRDFRSIFTNFFTIRKILKQCDIIHALDAFPYGVIATIFSFGLRKKIIITAVGTGSIGKLYHPIYSYFLKYAYRKADKIIAISNFTKREILKKAPELKIDVITPGVDFAKFHDHGFKNSNIDGLKPYILSVGALRWRKGYKKSIRAFGIVAKKFPELKYVIAGKKFADKYYNELTAFVSDLNLKGRVLIFTDVTQEELYEFYHKAELFCLLSQNLGHDVEGFGIVFLEAAAASLPVIGAKESGAEDAMLNDKNGMLIDPQDIDGLAKAIIKIMSDKTLHERMSNASLKLAKNSDWESKIEKHKEIYKKFELI